jgi:hypothetical protein
LGIATFVSNTLPQIVQSTPSNPGSTTSAGTLVMAGLAIAFTPVKSGKCHVIATMTCQNNTLLDGTGALLKYGTGTAPVNGAAVTGTSIGIQLNATSATANALVPLTLQGYVSLTPSTVYWLDLAFDAITGGTAAITGITVIITEYQV